MLRLTQYAVRGDMLLTLVCYVRGESHNNVFPVDIEEGNIVANLKDVIKAKTFNDIPANSLVLWKVSLPYSRDIKCDVERDLVDKEPLGPLDEISDLFPPPLKKRTLHIVVDRPAVGEFRLAAKMSSSNCFSHQINLPFLNYCAMCAGNLSTTSFQSKSKKEKQFTTSRKPSQRKRIQSSMI